MEIPVIPALDTLLPAVQHALLVRDLLLSLSGVEVLCSILKMYHHYHLTHDAFSIGHHFFCLPHFYPFCSHEALTYFTLHHLHYHHLIISPSFCFLHISWIVSLTPLSTMSPPHFTGLHTFPTSYPYLFKLILSTDTLPYLSFLPWLIFLILLPLQGQYIRVAASDSTAGSSSSSIVNAGDIQYIITHTFFTLLFFHKSIEPYQIFCFLITSYLILSYLIIYYHILSYLILSYLI